MTGIFGKHILYYLNLDVYNYCFATTETYHSSSTSTSPATADYLDSRMPPSIKKFMSLRQFMMRSQALSLYREALRTIKLVDSESERDYLRKWVRDDFEANRNHTDEAVVRMILTQGRNQIKELKEAVGGRRG